MKKAILVGIAAIAISPALALAQWSDDFESYSPGEQLYHVGGWSGWDDVQGASGNASADYAHSGRLSILSTGAGDAIHPFSGEFTSGQWTLSAWMYLESNAHTGTTYFIVNNEYNDGGPYSWTTQLQFMTDGTVNEFYRGGSATIAYDRWAEIRIDYDLTADTQSIWYDGQLVATGNTSNGGPLEIANIDLYSAGPSAYYDDISIVPVPGTLALLGLGGIGFAGRRRRRA
jgi:hypothetical protein